MDSTGQDRMARSRIVIILLLMVGMAAYAGSPFVTAWQIREAVRAGDTTRLRESVDWPSVRHTLKSSLAETREAISALTDAAGLPRPGLWQRMKAAAAPFLADPLIERYVTPEGVPKLYAWRQTLRQRVDKARAAARATAGAVVSKAHAAESPPEDWADRLGLSRMLSAYRRVERMGFSSPTRLEIVVADRIASPRRWHAVMELRGLSWQLTGMRVVNTLPVKSQAAAGATAGGQ